MKDARGHGSEGRGVVGSVVGSVVGGAKALGRKLDEFAADESGKVDSHHALGLTAAATIAEIAHEHGIEIQHLIHHLGRT